MIIKTINDVEIHKEGEGTYEFYLKGVNYRIAAMNVNAGITSGMLRAVADDMDGKAKVKKEKEPK